MYCVLTKIPAPRIAIPGGEGFAIFVFFFSLFKIFESDPSKQIKGQITVAAYSTANAICIVTALLIESNRKRSLNRITSSYKLQVYP